MKILTKAEFVAICRKIVVQMGQHPNMTNDQPGRLNTFVGFVDAEPYDKSPTFGAYYADFLAGRFWSRDWVAGGADPSQMVGSYPAIIAWENRSEFLKLDGNTLRTTLYLLSIDKLHCEGCPTEQLTPEDVYKNALFWLRAFIHQMFLHQVIQVFPSGEFLWMTQDEAQEMVDRGEINNFSVVGQRLSAWLSTGKATAVSKWSDGEKGAGALRGYITELTVEYCDPLEVITDTKPLNYTRVAVVKCESC